MKFRIGKKTLLQFGKFGCVEAIVWIFSRILVFTLVFETLFKWPIVSPVFLCIFVIPEGLTVKQ